MTLLTIVQDACDLLSLSRPSAVISSTDQTVRQLLAIAKEEAKELNERVEGGWQAMQREKTFSTVAQQEQTDALPTDLGWIIKDSAFNRTTNRGLVGPLSAQDWQAQSAFSTLAAQDVFRIRGSAWYFLEAPTAGETIAYEYVSSWYAQSSAGSRKATFTADEDTTYLSEHLITLGIRWRWLAAKGLDYAEHMMTYERVLSRAVARDGGMKTLTGRRRSSREANIPEGDFPQS